MKKIVLAAVTSALSIVMVYASAEDVDKIKEEMECIGLNYIPAGKKITVEVLLRNNSDRVLGIPYRSFERYEEYDGKTLIIKTFTEKELKGDFSLRAHDDGILYDDLKAVNSYTRRNDLTECGK